MDPRSLINWAVAFIISHLSEPLRARCRGRTRPAPGETGDTGRQWAPVEVSTVHDAAAPTEAWPSMYLVVLWVTISAPPLKGTAVDGEWRRCCPQSAARRGSWATLGKFLKIQHGQRRIGDALGKQHLWCWN